ncbi:hypothetical protein A6M57_1970 [Staphylococcus pseudintermedius]|nr:hypothetical protein A6M57_1970 [Staphylococcus pseudintermedius]
MKDNQKESRYGECGCLYSDFFNLSHLKLFTDFWTSVSEK